MKKDDLHKIKEVVDSSTGGDSEIRVNISKKRLALPANIMVFQAFAYLSATKLKASSNRVLMLLFGLAAYENAVGIDVATIMQHLDLGKTTVISGLKELEKEGIIIKIPYLYDKRRHEYRINPFSAWKGNSYARKEMISKFVDPDQLILFDGLITNDSGLKKIH